MQQKDLLLCVLGSAIVFASCRRSEDGAASSPESTPVSNGTTGAVAETPKLVHKTMPSGGHDRTYLLYAPESKDPLPLVIALHGRLGDGAGQDRLSHFSKIAAREKFVLVLPDGYSKSWNDARGEGPAFDAHYDDNQFLSDIIDELTLHHTVDPARVYVTGMSNGGFMAETFACKSPEKIAAIAIVGALLPEPLATCNPSKTMPVMMISGDHDPLVPYNGGGVGFGGGRGQVRSADDSAKFWAQRAGCQKSTDSQLPDAAPGDGTLTTLTHWEGCRDGAEVSLYRVIGGGHAWPGGWQYLGAWIVGKTSRDFDASEKIWEFFKDKKR
ncbi:MAG: extracellular catalytic domain type 1 short-chain-length polyhydroxyalkanoate depolymerase [Polyangiaceae bacterium]